ncbi:MAG: hypothetical protein CBC13_06760 [Planctomycetia bacterium TMED53]|nr:MAG: hypothetical protein CBC13_06760 [Planctomycetia bacterium TMED53]
MVFRLFSGDLVGLTGRMVEVEVDLVPALSSFVITGLPGPGIRESRQRIRSAIENSGFRFPDRYRVVIHLAPAAVTKDGSAFDLAIALAILAESGQIAADGLERHGFIGELALDGRLRPVRGGMTIGHHLGHHLCRRLQQVPGTHENLESPKLFIPLGQHPGTDTENLEEGFYQRGDSRSCEVIEAESLRRVVALLAGEIEESSSETSLRPMEPFENRSIEPQLNRTCIGREEAVDMSEVLGQTQARRALEICAAGEHPLLMVGPPGCGKSLLARRVPGILPPLDQESLREVRQINELLDGEAPNGQQRPFRAPHHSITVAGLVGGGTPIAPGEISRAHRGILFLDELPEVSLAALEALREPLEEGVITLSRAGGSVAFPGEFLLIAAMNPCPCGRGQTGRCRCRAQDRLRYQRRLSDPLLDRFDLKVALQREKLALFSSHEIDPPDSSATIQDRVLEARKWAENRGLGPSNRHLKWSDRSQWLLLDPDSEELLKQLEAEHSMSMRCWMRFLRVARTIADLAAKEKIERIHLLEALSLRGAMEVDS